MTNGRHVALGTVSFAISFAAWGSIKSGFERFREALEATLIDEVLGNLANQRRDIQSRKVETLVRECGDYLTLSLKSAERLESERQDLKHQVIGDKEIVDEVSVLNQKFIE